MSKSYSIFEVTDIPALIVGGILDIPYQGPLIEGVESPRTTINILRYVKELNTYVFRVTFEHVEYKQGRARNVEFTEYVATYKFPAFYNATNKYFLVQTSKYLAQAAIHQILKGATSVSGFVKRIELNSVQHLIESFHGAWFKVTENADVTSQAFFGPSVERDPRFAQALTEGDMQHIRFEYPFQGETFQVGISSDCAILIVNGNTDETLELKLVDDIKKNLIDAAKEASRSSN